MENLEWGSWNSEDRYATGFRPLKERSALGLRQESSGLKAKSSKRRFETNVTILTY
jgi:hypothetical protein